MSRVTRSKRKLEDQQVLVTEELIPRVLQPPSTPKKRARSSNSLALPLKKIYFEDVLRLSNPQPYVGTLPEDFTGTHDPGFVTGCHHVLSVDPSLYPVIIHQAFPAFKRHPKVHSVEAFWYLLVTAVLGQQVSGASARLVEAKFRALFGEEKPNASRTCEFSDEVLRLAGLSRQKAAYIRHISEVYATPGHPLTDLSFYETASPDEVTTALVGLKGIGVWLAKMFEIFTLNRLSVFADDDLGVARGMARYIAHRPEELERAKSIVSLDEAKRNCLKRKAKFATKDSKRDWVPIHDVYCREIAAKFHPYETVFMMVLWRLSLTNTEVLDASRYDL